MKIIKYRIVLFGCYSSNNSWQHLARPVTPQAASLQCWDWWRTCPCYQMQSVMPSMALLVTAPSVLTPLVILASDWSIQITWPDDWPLIGSQEEREPAVVTPEDPACHDGRTGLRGRNGNRSALCHSGPLLDVRVATRLDWPGSRPFWTGSVWKLERDAHRINKG